MHFFSHLIFFRWFCRTFNLYCTANINYFMWMSAHETTMALVYWLQPVRLVWSSLVNHLNRKFKVCRVQSSHITIFISKKISWMLHFLFQNLVLRSTDAIENAETSHISVRTINIPGEPYLLALSCDHTLLTVCYTINRKSFMDIFFVRSLLSAVSEKKNYNKNESKQIPSICFHYRMWMGISKSQRPYQKMLRLSKFYGIQLFEM